MTTYHRTTEQLCPECGKQIEQECRIVHTRDGHEGLTNWNDLPHSCIQHLRHLIAELKQSKANVEHRDNHFW